MTTTEVHKRCAVLGCSQNYPDLSQWYGCKDNIIPFLVKLGERLEECEQEILVCSMHWWGHIWKKVSSLGQEGFSQTVRGAKKNMDGIENFPTIILIAVLLCIFYSLNSSFLSRTEYNIPDVASSCTSKDCLSILEIFYLIQSLGNLQIKGIICICIDPHVNF